MALTKAEAEDLFEIAHQNNCVCMEAIKTARKAAAKEAEKLELAKTTLTKEELLALKERTAKEKIKKLPRQLEEQQTKGARPLYPPEKGGFIYAKNIVQLAKKFTDTIIEKENRKTKTKRI